MGTDYRKDGCRMAEVTAKVVIALDYDAKVKELEQAHQDLLMIQERFADVSGEYAKLKATIMLIRMRISALQTAIKAESFQ